MEDCQAELKKLNRRTDGSTILMVVELIIQQIERGEINEAILTRMSDGDKITLHPEISQWLDLNLATRDGFTLNPLIRKYLSDGLRKPKYRGNQNRVAGHCYIAAEAAYHLLPQGHLYQPCYLKIKGDTHWFLRHKLTHCVIDPTADQFTTPPDYDRGHRCGFLTKQPSKRTKELLRRMNADMAQRNP